MTAVGIIKVEKNKSEYGVLFIKASNPRDKRVAKTFMSLNCQNNHATTRINLKWNLKVKYNFSVSFLAQEKKQISKPWPNF